MNTNVYKIGLGLAIALLICLFPMPYGYYQFVRFIATAIFAYFSFCFFKENKEGLGFLFAALTILFQPFIKVALGRTMWNIVDVIVAVLLIVMFVKDHDKREPSL